MNKRWWYGLLILPLAGTLVPPFYARAQPELFGFPFFYWYQLVWVVLASLFTWIVYVRTRETPHG
ncbi:MAG: DUF3311 domain-containing protein [Candidatus Baltobacteraceae bacterium]